MRIRRIPGLHRTAVAIVVSIAVAACASSSGRTTGPDRTTSTSAGGKGTTTSAAPATTATTALTSDTLFGDASIIAVDQAEAATYFAIASEDPINVADARLAQYAAGKQLVNLRATLNQFSFRHQHLVGTYKGSQYRVVQRMTGAVLVLSCDLDTTAVVDNITGQVVEPAANRSALINTRLDLVNGRWMVTDSGQRSPAC